MTKGILPPPPLPKRDGHGPDLSGSGFFQNFGALDHGRAAGRYEGGLHVGKWRAC